MAWNVKDWMEEQKRLEEQKRKNAKAQVSREEAVKKIKADAAKPASMPKSTSGNAVVYTPLPVHSKTAKEQAAVSQSAASKPKSTRREFYSQPADIGSRVNELRDRLEKNRAKVQGYPTRLETIKKIYQVTGDKKYYDKYERVFKEYYDVKKQYDADVNEFNAYIAGEKKRYNDWKSTVRKPELIRPEIEAYTRKINELEELRGNIGREYGGLGVEKSAAIAKQIEQMKAKRDKLSEEYAHSMQLMQSDKQKNAQPQRSYIAEAKAATEKTMTNQSTLTDDERKARMRELEAEMRQLNTAIAGAGRVGNNEVLSAQVEQMKKRLAAAGAEYKEHQRAGAYSYEDELNRKIEDARSQLAKAEANIPDMPRGVISPEQAMEYKNKMAATAERDKMQGELEGYKTEAEQIEYLNKYADKEYGDNPFGQYAANRRVGATEVKSNMAWAAYLDNPTEENYNYAMALDELSGAIQKNNKETLADDAFLPWITQDMAQYMPQFWGQAKESAKGAALGAAIGTVIAPGAGTLKGAQAGVVAGSGKFSFDMMRGAAFKELRQLTNDEEAARKAATNEAVLASIIEMGDTALDLLTFGTGSVFKALGIEAVKDISESAIKKAIKLVADYGLNIVSEGSEEGIQQFISIANRKRLAQGLPPGDIGDLLKDTVQLAGDAFTGKDKESAAEAWDAFKGGAIIGGIMGAPKTAVRAVDTVKTAIEEKRDAKAALDELERARARENMASGIDAYLDDAQKNTAESGGDSFRRKILNYSKKQIENWKSSKKIVVYENQEQLQDFVDSAIHETNDQRKMYFGTVGQELADDIQRATGFKLFGKNITLRADNVRKTLKSHGNAKKEALRGQRAITPDDFKLVPIVIAEPDNILPSPEKYNGKDTVIFEKNVDGSKVTVVAVDSGGSLDLFMQTMYAGKQKGSIANMTDVDTPTITPETTVGTASTNSIPQPAPIVNTGDAVLDNVIGELEPGKNIKARQVTAITKSRSAMRKLGQISGERITAITDELDQRKAITRALEQVRDRNATASEQIVDDDVAGVAESGVTPHQSADADSFPSRGSQRETAIAQGTEAGYNNDIGNKERTLPKIRNKKYPKLGKTEYTLVQRAQISKYGGIEEGSMPDIGYVYAYDMFYYIENYGPGEFRVVYRFDPATAQERIKFFREVIDNGYNEESSRSTSLYQTSQQSGNNEQGRYDVDSHVAGNSRGIQNNERMAGETDIDVNFSGDTKESNGSKRDGIRVSTTKPIVDTQGRALGLDGAPYAREGAGLVRDANYRRANIPARKARVLDAIAKVTGTKIVFVPEIDGGDVNAKYENGVIKIALSCQNPVGVAFTHELVHRIKDVDPETYAELKRYVYENMEEESLRRIEEKTEKAYADDDTVDIQEEVVADAFGYILGDSVRIEQFVRDNRKTAEKIADWMRDLIIRIKKWSIREGWMTREELYAGNGTKYDASGKKAFAELTEDLDAMAQALSNAIEATAQAVQDGTEQHATVGEKYSINSNFASQIDAWDGKTNYIFDVGKTSNPLRSIGVQDKKIVWHGKKIAEILRKHQNMTREIVKQVPEILENPVIVLKSQQAESRIAIFGEVKDSSGAPVVAVIELYPTNRGGEVLDMNVIASAYGKNSNPAGFISNSDLLYLDPNKKRTGRWLNAVGLQLPSVASTHLGSIGTITYADGKVNIQGVPYEQYMQSGAGNSQNSKSSRKSMNDAYRELLEEYGELKPGEKPARVVQVPKKTGKNQHVRRGARTIMEAGSVPDEFASEMEQEIVNGTFSYEPQADKRTLERVNADIEYNGWEESMARWKAVVNGTERASKENIVLGETLLVHAANAGDTELAMKLAAELAAEATRAGQEIQAIRLLKKMSPEGRLYHAQKHIAKLQEEINERHGRGKYQIVVPEAMYKNLINATTEEEMRAAEEALYTNVAEQIPPTLYDQWNSWRYIAMLANTRTHIKNFVGNFIFMPVRGIKNMVKIVLESAMFRKSNEYKTASIKAYLRNGENKGAREFIKADRESNDVLKQNSKYTPENIISEKRKIFTRKWLAWVEWVRKNNLKLLEKSDMFFKKKVYDNSFLQYMLSNKYTVEFLESGTKEAKQALERGRQYAIDEALKATFQDANKLAESLNKMTRIKKGDSAVAIVGKVAAEGTLPFKKTPMNIVKRAGEYSPVGLIDGVYKAIAYTVAGKYTPMQAIDRIASGLTGTGLLMMGIWLAYMGVLKGKLGDDREDEFKKLQGEQGYAMVIGDHTYTLDWAAPAVLPLFVGVEIYEQMKSTADEDKSWFSNTLDALSNVTEPMLEMSMLQGLQDVIDNVSFSDNKLSAVVTSALTSYVTQGVPTLFGQIARTIDGTRRSTYASKSSKLTKGGQRTLNKIGAKTPGVSSTLEPYVDEWGREGDNGGIVERILENFVSPGYYSKKETDSVEREIARLYAETSENSVLPKRAESSFSYKEKTYYKTPEELTKYQKTFGGTSYKLRKAAYADSNYKRLTDEEKVAVAEKIAEVANSRAKIEFFKGRDVEYEPDSFMEKLDEARKAGIGEHVVILAWVLQKDVESIKDKDGEPVNYSSSLRKRSAIDKARPSLSLERRRALYEMFGVGKDVIKMSDESVKTRLKSMEKKYAKYNKKKGA